MHKHLLIRIRADALDLCDRIREIDPDYRLFYNREKERFEVYLDEEGKRRTAVLPFGQLDARTERYLRETRVERADQIFAGMPKVF